MIVILMIILVLFLVLVGWMWNSLGSIEKKTKFVCMACGLVFVYVLTFVIFNISKMGIHYEDMNVMKVIRNVFVLLFMIINGYVILPFTFKRLEQINNDEIEKDKLIRSFVTLVILIVILVVFESRYLGNVQVGILKMLE